MLNLFSIPSSFSRSFHRKRGNKVLIISILCLFITIQAKAQFITINLEVPPRTEMSNASNVELELLPNKRSNLELSKNKTSNHELSSNQNSDYETLVAEGVIDISSCENMYVIATLSSSKFMENENGDKLKMDVSFSYRNDGQNKLPGIKADGRAVFPISDSDRIIEFMKGKPIMISSYIYLHISTDIPRQKNTNYQGEYLLSMEYN